MVRNLPESSLSARALDGIVAALSPSGLILRGGFNFVPADNPPAGPSGPCAKSVLLVGNAGTPYWPHFSSWRAARPADPANPLDIWSREIVEGIAAEVGARAVFPSDRPYMPFQQWAMRAEALKPSPLGILMHPEYGLWHAYRGALLFDAALDLPDAEKPVHLCDACVGKPCKKACPVDAYSQAGFAYEACLAHVRSAAGAACMSGGCLDRNACPYGAAYRYPADVQAFHMRAFANR